MLILENGGIWYTFSKKMFLISVGLMFKTNTENNCEISGSHADEY
jgi:hypothetical protein